MDRELESGLSRLVELFYKNSPPLPPVRTPKRKQEKPAKPASEYAYRPSKDLTIRRGPYGPRLSEEYSRCGKRVLWPCPQRVQAMRERRIQKELSAQELAKRQGRPFWDEAGRLRAATEDLEAVKRLLEGGK